MDKGDSGDKANRSPIEIIQIDFYHRLSSRNKTRIGSLGDMRETYTANEANENLRFGTQIFRIQLSHQIRII